MKKNSKITKLAFFALLLIFLSGYHPALTFPPTIKPTKAFAQNLQQEEIISSSFPKPIVLPHLGYLSTRFSNWHPGVDIAATLGMPIHPITEGGVTEVGKDFFGLGNFVEVLHQNGFKSKYAHMGKVYVKVGQKITSDNILGEVGLTGATSGPHTHLEITKDEDYIDPQTILPEIPTR